MIITLRQLAKAVEELYPSDEYDNHIKFMGIAEHIYATEFRTYNSKHRLIARADISELSDNGVAKYGGTTYKSFGYNKINDLIDAYSNEIPSERERPNQFNYSLSKNEIPVYKEIFNI